MNFSALNVDFKSPSLDFLGLSRRHQRAAPCKNRYFTVIGQSFVKTVADNRGHAALVTSFLVVAYQHR